MRLNDERSQVRRVAADFRAQFGSGSYGADVRGINVGDELLKLDAETATAEQVVELIGNSSWAEPKQCYECNTVTWKTVEVGDDEDFECTAIVCVDCLKKALSLIESC